MSHRNLGDWGSGPNGIAGREPAQWLAYARRRPLLARILVASTLERVPQRGEAFVGWCVRFAVRPQWKAIAQTLEQAGRQSSPSGVEEHSFAVHRRSSHESAAADDFAAQLASASRIVAACTHWCGVEAAYWLSLCRPIEPLSGPTFGLGRWLETLPGPERCRALAARLLTAVSSPADPLFVEPAFGGALLPNRAFAPIPFWDELVASVRQLMNLEAEPFSESDRQRLWQSARIAQVEDELADCRSLLALWTHRTPEERVSAAAAILACTTRGSAALWLSAEGSSGIGATFPSSPLSFFRGTRMDFESQLDRRLRSSTDLVDAAGACFGRLYLERAVDLGESLKVLAAALEQALLTDRLARLVEALQDQRLADLDTLDRELRARLRTLVGALAAGAGHEINNPLATIRGYAQRLAAGETEPDRRQMLRRIDEQADRIHRMIKDLRLIGRDSVPRTEPVRIESVLERAAAAAARARPAMRLLLEPAHPLRHDARLLGNDDDLVRLFAELITNAFDAQSRATVSVRVSQSADGRQCLVMVADGGPGFNPTDRRCALGPFYSGRSAGRGLGMGLAVAARIVEDHGGSLQITYDSGTTVTVSLPLSTDETQANDCDQSRTAA